MIKLTGSQAIEVAEAADLFLKKYNDPTEDLIEFLTVAEAREIAKQDAGLIYLEFRATDDQISLLAGEALAAGDVEQYKLCEAALAGNDLGRQMCEEAMLSALGMELRPSGRVR